MPPKKKWQRAKAEPLDQRFMLRCSQAELTEWTERAQELGLTLSAWIRMRLKEKKS